MPIPTQSIQRAAFGHGRPGGQEDYSRAQPGNPFEARRPRGTAPLAITAKAPVQHLPTAPYDDPKDSHPGPVGPPAVRPWQQDSSTVFWQKATEKDYAPNPQGSTIREPIGGGRFQHSAPDPKWTPETVIRTLYAPVGSQLYGRPQDQRMARRVNQTHESMAGRKRNYQILPGERPVHRLTPTYRIVPPSATEQALAQQTPMVQVVPLEDRSQNGSWRLL